MRSRSSVALLLLSVLGPPAGAEIVERVVARVNGDVVTLSELEARQLAAVQQAQIPAEGVEAFLRSHNARLLQQAVDDLLLVQRGRELGIRPRDEYVTEILEGIKKDNGIATEADFALALRRENMTRGDLRRSIERSLVRRQVLSRDLESRITITDAEMLADYDAHRASFARPAGVHLQEIVLPAESEGAADIVRRARAGEDFAALALAHSIAESKAHGGDLGFVVPEDLAPALAAALVDLADGAVTEPIPVGDTLRVVRLAGRREAGIASYEQVRDEIRKRLADARFEQEYEGYVASLRKGADVLVLAREVSLQVPETAARPSLVPSPAPTPAPAAGVDEISVTGSARPQHVVPPAAGQETPPPSPPPPPR